MTGSEQKEISYQHKMAEGIFRNVMRECHPAGGGVNFYTSSHSTFNGDLLLVYPSPHGGFYAIVGDVTGHGLPAAICTIPIARTFLSMAKKGLGIGVVASEINKTLKSILPDGMMFAATLVECQHDGCTMQLWSGGLPDSLVVANGRVVRRLPAKHMPLGALEQHELSFELHHLVLAPGQSLLIATDGIGEAQNAEGEFYGDQRFENVINSQAPRQPVLPALLDDLHAFCGEQLANDRDDISLLEISAPVDVDLLSPPDDTPPEAEFSLSPLPISSLVALDSEQLKAFNPVPWVRRLLSGVVGQSTELDLISTVLTEMYCNALDHGILELDSIDKMTDEGFLAFYRQRQERLDNMSGAELTIGLTYRPERSQLVMEVSHNGQTFEPSWLHEAGKFQAPAMGEDLPFGRGLQLIYSLCEQINYSQQGRCMQVTYPLTGGIAGQPPGE